MKKRLLILLIAFVLLMPATLVRARDMDMDALPEVEDVTKTIEQESKRDWQATVGLGAAVVPDYEGSNDYQGVPFPFFRVHWRSGYSVELEGLTLRANLVRSAMWKFGPVIRYRMGREDVEDSAVDKMRDIDDSTEAGAFLKVIVDNWDARVEAVADVSDGHDGYLIGFYTGYSVPIDKSLRMTFGASATYADDDYMDTYFSIDENNSIRSGLDTYKADGGFKDVGATLSALYNMSKNWGIMSVVGYKRLLNDAKDSPIVDKRGSADQWIAGALVTYSWY
jgi:outer membrane protein